MTTPRQSTITGWGLYAPERIVTNDELAQTLDTTDEWIRTRSGIGQRHVVGPDEFTSTMSTAAAERAMAQSGVAADDLDLILVATSTPDYLTPPVSSQIQDMLGANCGAMALVVGCTGFVYAVVTAHQFIATGAARTVLVIGAETITRNLNWEDRSTCVLFGDGAGAVVMQATDEVDAGVQAFVLGSDGSGAEHLIQYSGGTRTPPTAETIAAGDNYLRMNGREVFKFATSKMVQSLDQVMTDAGITADDIDLFIPHQANARIIEYAAQQAGIPMEKVVMNVERYGNTSAATIPIALAEAFDAGRAKPGDTLAFVGFGAGLTWAACIFQLAAKPAAPKEAKQHAHPAIEGFIA
jgi:3-oxoacyl-[acyl-carrier-protein] synthase-3